MNSTSPCQFVPETSPTEPSLTRDEVAAKPGPRIRLCPGNAPRTIWEYLLIPRVFLTAIICAVSTALHIGFGIYIWLFAE
jgi:hypothetical protein